MLDAENENLQNTNEDMQKNEIETNLEREEIEKTSVSENKTEEDVVSDIDNEIAESSENQNEVNLEHSKEAVVDYVAMGLEELVNYFEKVIKELPIQKVNNHYKAIKNSFDVQFSKILADKKAVFLSEGGESIDFSYSNPLKIKFNELSKSYKEERAKYYKNLETQFKDNLELRLNTIEHLKELIENAESKTMYNKFKDIQDRWRKIGPVAKEKYNDTWRTFHHHVERFYDLLHLNNDFRELEFKHNLEEKLKLITRVEKLSESKDINYLFKQLQVIHKAWKEDVGPVSKESRESVWQKFSAATKKIHDKRHEFYKILKDKYEENIVEKLKIIDQIKAIDFTKNSKHSDWQKSIKVLEELRQVFFKAGSVPKSESDKIWNKFKEATRKFNRNKNSFYKNIKSVQQENLDEKMKLIEQAESLKDSEDWKEVTEVMKKIQADWRKIGHVPRKYSDKIWNQFKGACNHYFDRFHTYQNAGSKEEQEIFDKKKSLLDTIKKEAETSDNVDLDSVKNYIKDWRSLGKVPHSMRHIEAKFSKVVDKLFSSLSIDHKQKEMIKFENQMEGLLAQNNLRKLDGEQIYIRKKIDESAREIQQLENNMSFFANAKADNPLLKNVIKNIENYKKDLDVLKSKLSYLSNLDY